MVVFVTIAGMVAEAAAAKVYVGLFKDDAVAVIDTSTNKVLRTISVPKGPHGLVVTPDGAKVYVSSDGDSTVSVIDTATDRVVRSVDVGPNPHGLAIAPDGSRVLVSAWGANQALFIDTATDQIVGRVPVAQAHNGALECRRPHRLGRLAAAGRHRAGPHRRRRPEGGRARSARSHPARARSESGWTPPLLHGRRAGGRARARHHEPADRGADRGGRLAASGAAHRGWAVGTGAEPGPGRAGIIDTSGDTVAGTVTVGKTPHWVGSSSDGTLAYVTNEGSNDVSVVQLAGRKVVATIPVGNAPRKVAVQPGVITSAARHRVQRGRAPRRRLFLRAQGHPGPCRPAAAAADRERRQHAAQPERPGPGDRP